MLRAAADGVIVGSALVRKLEHANAQSIDAIVNEIGAQVESLSKALA